MPEASRIPGPTPARTPLTGGLTRTAAPATGTTPDSILLIWWGKLCPWTVPYLGDAVVISPPVYPPFFDWVPEAGGRLLEVPLARGATGWRLDLPALERAFATHPAAYVLCNPHNPVGRAHSDGELAALVMRG